jgi:DME family drug/metabolite transporter
VGCILVSGAADFSKWYTNALGIITGILSGLLYAFYSLMGRFASQRGINPWTSLFYTFLFAALILLTINLLPVEFANATVVEPSDLFYLGKQWRGWGLLFLLAAGPTLLGFGLYNISLGLLPSSTANLIVTLEPVFTCITAYLLLGERLSLIELVGSGIILSAVILIRIQKKKLSN